MPSNLPSLDVTGINGPCRPCASCGNATGSCFVSLSMMPFSTARLVRATLLIAGGVLFVVLLRGVNLEVSWSRVRQAGWLLVPAFGCYVAGVLLAARAWQILLTPRPRFLRVACIHWAGSAVTSLSAAPFGEVLKGALLAERSRRPVISSLIVYNALNAGLMLASSSAGLLAFALWFNASSGVVRTCVALAAVLLSIVGAGFSLFKWIGFRAVVSARSGRSQALTEIVTRAAHVPTRDACVAALHLVCTRVLLVAESGLYLKALFPNEGLARLILLALLTQSAAQLLDWGLAVVPGRIGVAEGGTFMIYGAVGLDPGTGLAFALLRRCRKSVGVGLGLMAGVIARSPAMRTDAQATDPGTPIRRTRHVEGLDR